MQTEKLSLVLGRPDRFTLTYEGVSNYRNLTFHLDGQPIAHFDTREELLTPQPVGLPDGQVLVVSFLYGASLPAMKVFPDEAAYRNAQTQAGQDNALYLYIPIKRLVWLSLLTFGCYTYYWIYKNWAYLKRRNMLEINPVLRGIFGVFFCHSLLKNIRFDPRANEVLPAEFPNHALATGWVFFILAGAAMVTPSVAFFFSVFPFMLSFIFLLPVQRYLNQLQQKMGKTEYCPFTNGHIMCIVGSWCLAFSILIVASIVLGIIYAYNPSLYTTP